MVARVRAAALSWRVGWAVGSADWYLSQQPTTRIKFHLKQSDHKGKSLEWVEVG